jgi:hypothetical protein
MSRFLICTSSFELWKLLGWLDLDLTVQSQGLTLAETWHVDIWYVCTLADKVMREEIGERRNRISLVSL